MSSNPPGDWRGGPAPSAPSTPGAWAPQGQPTYGSPPPGAPGYPYPPPGAPPYPAAPGPQPPPPQGGYPAYGQPAGTYPGPAYPAPPAPGQPTYPQASAPTQPAYVPAPDQPPPMPPAGQWAPPDAADSQVPPAAPVPPAAETRRSRERAPILGGVILAGIGLFLLVGQVVDDAGEWVPLLIGLIFLAAFVTRREYGFLVAGSIITGVGAGVVLQDAAPDDLSGAVMTLSIAAGFLAIWVVGTLLRLRENHWWPFIPGGILALVGASQLSDADVDGVLRWWPLIIVAIGVLIIVRAWLRPGRRT